MADNQKNGLGDLVHNAFLAGVGAAAIVGEKAGQVVDDLVKKGELTVQQGKVVNEELSQKASDAVSETVQATVKSTLKTMSPEQRQKFMDAMQEALDEVNASEAEEPAPTAAGVDAMESEGGVDPAQGTPAAEEVDAVEADVVETPDEK